MNQTYNFKWWQNTIVYQIYPRSFKDSTGNGIGDLRGVISKLDYVVDLGIETIWFNPFFPSPQQDHGYDVSNYRDIHPTYGTMKDFDELISKIHKHNLKIVLDLVINHTSMKHPWFKESASSRDNPKRDWYIWRDGRKPNGKKPPNNWKQNVGGSAWTYYENTDQWVYHHFLPFLVDLNYRNPDVKEEMFNIIKFWLDKGVDGFRLDIFHSIYEDKDLKDDKFCFKVFPSDDSVATLFRCHKYDLNLPETYDFAVELRTLIDSYDNPKRFLVGEVFGSFKDVIKYYGPKNNGLNLVFLFQLTSAILSFNPQKIREILVKIEKHLPYPFTPTCVYGNHDRTRYITLLGNNEEKVKLLVTMQLTLRSVPFIYYGEEIGLPNTWFKLKNSKDPIAQKYATFPIPQITKLLGVVLSRDGCRTPMQWSSESNAGFSDNPNAEPWLKVSDSYEQVNVEAQQNDPRSLLNHYKKLIKIRKENIELQIGNLRFINNENLKDRILGYERIFDKKSLFIYLNFSKESIKINLPIERYSIQFRSSKIIANPEIQHDSTRIKLFPYEGIILKLL
ncbi:MAG: alpha-glucosidase [Candidatus Lokiarchaeota archaeon]|nr:alpha-glucosidase [Candidatus Lokiarchaeota archaeon]MBD3340031.1 alpha-glucosidase [Candidatus Lokiarchaeota archaeon]